jgi:hypothetical protein
MGELDFDKEIESLVAQYRHAADLIVAKLEAGSRYALSTKKQRVLLAEILAILDRLDAESRAWVDKHIPTAWRAGQATALVGIGEAATFAKAADIVSGIGMVNEDMVKAIVSDTHEDLLAATNNMRVKAKRAVRNAIIPHTRLASITGEKAKSVAKRASDDVRAARVATVDVAGRRWSPEVYTRVIVKTKLAQAHREGATEQAVAYGFDLARISAHGAKDACRNFEGALLSLTGATAGYRTVAELKASGLIFHPQCRHVISPLNPALMPESEREKAEAMVEKVDEALKLAADGKMNSHGMKKGA